MPKLVFHSDDSFVAFGQSGSAVTGNDKARLFPLVQSASISVDSAGARQVSNFLGAKTTGIDDLVKQPSVNIDLSYYLSPYGVNERICGMSGSGSSGIGSFLEPIRSYHNNIYFAFNNKEPQEGFSEPRYTGDGYWTDHSFMSVGNCYLTKYSLNFSINEPVRASMSFVGDNISTAYGIGDDIPLPSRSLSGTPATGVLDLDDMYTGLASGMAIRTEGRTAYNPSVTLPYRCTVELSELQGGGISISTGSRPVIQSISLNASIDRTPYYGLGNNYPTTRKASLPIDGTLDIDFLISGIKTGELDTLVSAETGHYIKIKCVDFKDTGVFLIYEIPRARLQSATYNCDIHNTYKCQMKFAVDDFGYSLTAPDIEVLPPTTPYDDTFDIYVGGSPAFETSVTTNRIVMIDEFGRIVTGSMSGAMDFGSGFSGSVRKVVEDASGRLICVGDFTGYRGTACNRIARINTNGTIDSSFASNVSSWGGFNDIAHVVTMHTGNKILVGGRFTNVSSYLRRINENGTLDTSFANVNFQEISGGASGFSNGKTSYPFIHAIKVDGSSRVLVGGGFNSVDGTQMRHLCRLNSSGGLDGTLTTTNSNSFLHYSTSNSGWWAADLANRQSCIVNDIAVHEATNQIFIVGHGNMINNNVGYNIGRFTSSGLIQSRYGANLTNQWPSSTVYETSPLYTIAIHPSGDSFYVGGSFTTQRTSPNLASNRRNGVMRCNFTTDGYDLYFSKDSPSSNDTSSAGFTFSSNTDVRKILLQKDGSMIVVGDFTVCRNMPVKRMAKLNAWGREDFSFNFGGGVNAIARDIINLSGGNNSGTNNKIIVGDFTEFTQKTDRTLRKYKTDGFENTGFDAHFNSMPLAIIQQPDLKVIVGGSFTKYGDTICNKIARIDRSGNYDSTFVIGSGFNGTVHALQLYPDGRILVGGEFTSYNGTGRNQLARLHSNGSLDTSFLPSGGFGNVTGLASTGTILFRNPVVYCLARDTISTDIYAGGLFGYYVGSACRNVAKITDYGAFRSGWRLGASTSGVDGAVRTIVVRPSGVNGSGINAGNIIIGGDFYNAGADTTPYRLKEFTSNGTYNSASGINNRLSQSSRHPDDKVYSLTLQEDNKLIVGGAFENAGGLSKKYLTRLDVSGSGDATFDATLNSTGFNRVFDVKYVANTGDLSQSEIIACGRFSTINGTSSPLLVSLAKSGAVAQAYAPSGAAPPDDFLYKLGIAEQNGDTNDFYVAGALDYETTETGSGLYSFNEDGSRDFNFITSGGFSGNVYAIDRQADGKFIVGGSFTGYRGTPCNRIARLNTNGSYDSTFSIGQGFDGTVRCVVIQTGDGMALVGGEFTNYDGASKNKLARLATNGVGDGSLSIGVGFNSTVHCVAVDSVGSIYVGGEFTTYKSLTENSIIKLNQYGAKDAGFSTLGINVGGGAVRALKIQADGKIIAAGTFTYYNSATANRIIRINTDGTRDAGWTVSATALGGDVYAVAIQADGKILIGGAFATHSSIYVNRLMRLNTDGGRDTSWPSSAASTTSVGFNNGSVRDLKILADGRILAVGSFTSHRNRPCGKMALLDSNGLRNESLNDGDFGAGSLYCLNLLSNNKFIVGGESISTYKAVKGNKVIKMTPRFTIDTNFSLGSGFNGNCLVVAKQSDGKILVGGSFTTYNGSSQNRLIRLNASGSKDSSFDIGSGFDGIIRAIAIQTDGQIVVAGDFTAFRGLSRNKIARLTNLGADDSLFVVGTGFGPVGCRVNSLKIDSSGKIYAGGSFLSYQGSAREKLTPISTNGTIATFSMGGGFNGDVTSLELNSSGTQIIVIGEFTTFAGVTRNRIIGLTTAGSFDSSFNMYNPAGGFNDSAYFITRLANDNYAIVGNFTSYKGTSEDMGLVISFDGSTNAYHNLGFDKPPAVIISKLDGRIFVGGPFTLATSNAAQSFANYDSLGRYVSTASGISLASPSNIIFSIS